MGDSQIVSFKLQPGATARVDQRGNQLDVVFSAANRIPPVNSGNPSEDRGRDAAGTMPSDSAAPRVRTVPGREGSIGSGEPRGQAYPQTNSNKSENNQLTTATVATASASPSSSHRRRFCRLGLRRLINPYRPRHQSRSQVPVQRKVLRVRPVF